MKLPTPEDMGRAPVWENYIVAQLVQASLGQIPEHALAMGVKVTGACICLCFQLSEATENDLEDIADIASELQGLVGEHVDIESVYEIRGAPDITPFDGVCWTFVERMPEMRAAGLTDNWGNKGG